MRGHGEPEHLWQLACAGMWQSYWPRRGRELLSRLCQAWLLYQPEQGTLKQVTALWPLRHAWVAYGCDYIYYRPTPDIHLHGRIWHISTAGTRGGARLPRNCPHAFYLGAHMLPSKLAAT